MSDGYRSVAVQRGKERSSQDIRDKQKKKKKLTKSSNIKPKCHSLTIRPLSDFATQFEIIARLAMIPRR